MIRGMVLRLHGSIDPSILNEYYNGIDKFYDIISRGKYDIYEYLDMLEGDSRIMPYLCENYVGDDESEVISIYGTVAFNEFIDLIDEIDSTITKYLGDADYCIDSVDMNGILRIRFDDDQFLGSG